MKHFWACIFLLFSFSFIHAQNVLKDSSAIKNNSDTTSTIIIGNINVVGNKKTKAFIILREMAFKQGDIIAASALDNKLRESRELIYNTALFVDDTVFVSNKTNNIVDVTVQVKERWYFFPLPYFRVSERNFNTWWVKDKASFDRVDYGVVLAHNNLTGRNDKLNIWLTNGYDQQISLRYSIPFINKALTKGFSVGFAYVRQHQINYGTDSANVQELLKLDNDYAHGFTRFDFTYTYRPNQRIRHSFRVSYNSEWIADTVLKLNNTYFPNQLTKIQYPDFTYTLQYFNANYYSYPTKGFIGYASIYKRGLNNLTDMWQITARGIYATPLSKKSYLRFEGIGTVKFPNNQYFFSQAMFGYGFMQMQGLEYYVIDGMAGALGKITFGHQLFHFVVKNNVIKSKSHDKIPFRIYAKAYGNAGYAYNPYVQNNLLNNTLLHSYGVGLDVVTIYDIVFRIEYSINQLGGKGIYLHANQY